MGVKQNRCKDRVDTLNTCMCLGFIQKKLNVYRSYKTCTDFKELTHKKLTNLLLTNNSTVSR